ncbi:hypothetical protein H6F89_12625 [Cyanobacteria bacterium FACHB-63]|nr:hypothetical protein [Cyanobacteria bacterium FACHB-63]
MRSGITQFSGTEAWGSKDVSYSAGNPLIDQGVGALDLTAFYEFSGDSEIAMSEFYNNLTTLGSSTGSKSGMMSGFYDTIQKQGFPVNCCKLSRQTVYDFGRSRND